MPKKKPAAAQGTISHLAVAASLARPEATNPFTVPDFPKGAIPKGTKLAMDSTSADVLAWASGLYAQYGAILEGQAFLGYTILAAMAQRPEYRRMVETIATQMTREWIRFKSAGGDESKAEKIAKLNAAMVKLRVREVFEKAITEDGFFGRSHIYVDTGATENRDELVKPIGDGDSAKYKIGKGALKAFRNVEAVWCYPARYNSTDPLAADWYEPQTWFVMGKEIHRSRFLTLIGREVPDVLKPAYAFGGLPLTQMAKPYVDNWLRTRQSVSDLIQAFSVMVFSTNMADVLNAGQGTEFFKRLDVFNNIRNNRGVMAVDKEAEDLKALAVPLGTLDKLQAQAQEQQGSVTGIPLIFLLGLSPEGLNASADGEIRAFFDWIHSRQESELRPKVKTATDLVQVSEFGSVDDDIVFEFVKLWTLDEKEESERRHTEATTDDVYYSMGAVSAEEVRHKLAHDPDSPYSLQVEGDPEPPEPVAPPGSETALKQAAENAPPTANGAKPGAKPGKEGAPGVQ